MKLPNSTPSDSELQKELNQISIEACQHILDEGTASEDVLQDAFETIADLTRHPLRKEDKPFAASLLASLRTLGKRAFNGDQGAFDWLDEFVVAAQRLEHWTTDWSHKRQNFADFMLALEDLEKFTK